MGLILGIGGAHVDRRGQIAVDFVPGASNPGTMGEEAGGGTFNAVRVAVQCGHEGAIVSVRGGDGAGELVGAAVADAGLRDLSAIFLDRRTPSYTALIDRNGDVIAALADMSLYDLAFPRILRRSSLRGAVETADAILTDANLPPEALARVARMASAKPIHAVAISPAKVTRLAAILPSLAGLFMNGREAAVLAGLAGDADPAELVTGLRKAGLVRGVVTAGGEAAIGFDGSGLYSLVPPTPRHIADVTGAGDAFAGATVAALTAGLTFGEAMRHGAAASLLTIESARASAQFGRSDFASALALVGVPHYVPLPAAQRAETASVSENADVP